MNRINENLRKECLHHTNTLAPELNSSPTFCDFAKILHICISTATRNETSEEF